MALTPGTLNVFRNMTHFKMAICEHISPLKTVRKVLLDKGIIKAQTSPDGKISRYVVNDEMPKNIFFTKKSPEEIAASKTRLPAIRRTETPILSLADSEMVQKNF